MPIYEYKCSKCGDEVEILRAMADDLPDCTDCGIPMERQITAPAMIKIKGGGGYPSRRKQIRNTTCRIHPSLERDPNRVYL